MDEPNGSLLRVGWFIHEDHRCAGHRVTEPEGDAPMGGRLTDGELEQLRYLLHRFAEHDLDQFDNWRLDTSHGPVFVMLTRELPQGWSAEAFTPVQM